MLTRASLFLNAVLLTMLVALLLGSAPARARFWISFAQRETVSNVTMFWKLHDLGAEGERAAASWLASYDGEKENWSLALTLIHFLSYSHDDSWFEGAVDTIDRVSGLGDNILYNRAARCDAPALVKLLAHPNDEVKVAAISVLSSLSLSRRGSPHIEVNWLPESVFIGDRLAALRKVADSPDVSEDVRALAEHCLRRLSRSSFSGPEGESKFKGDSDDAKRR